MEHNKCITSYTYISREQTICISKLRLYIYARLYVYVCVCQCVCVIQTNLIFIKISIYIFLFQNLCNSKNLCKTGNAFSRFFKNKQEEINLFKISVYYIKYLLFPQSKRLEKKNVYSYHHCCIIL